MKEVMMLKGAKTLVDVCTKVQPKEKVLVVTDLSKTGIAKAIVTIAADRGAETMMMVMQPRERAGQEPPEPVAEAMKAADVVFVPVSYSITHTHAVKDAAATGTRLIVMTDFTEEMMVGGGIEADFDAVKPVCQGVAQRLEQGKKIRITTPAGTDITMDSTGRRGNALFCVVEPGQFSTVPTVEANTTPIEGSSEGIIVCNASIPYLGIGVIQEPVVATVKNGFIVDIAGGKQADILKRDLESHNDPLVYNVAEIGVGLNPKCRMCGIMLEDEGVQGTAHFGIGTSITLGGDTKASIHYDLLVWQPRIEVDGQVLIDDTEVNLY